MNILGINSFFEHPSVALLVDGRLTFAAEDERFTRIKHGKGYTPYRTYIPYAAMHAALAFAGLTTRDVDRIAYSYSSTDHLIAMWGSLVGRRYSSLREEWAALGSAWNFRRALKQGYELPLRFRDRIDPAHLGRVRFEEWNHHLSHAASAFFCSGFSESLVVVSDGSGEAACTSIYVGRGRKLERIDQISLPSSLGIFYSTITRHLGFEPFSDEYKVMGLAAYGTPRFRDAMAQIVVLEDRGRYRVDTRHLLSLERLLGPPRVPGTPLTDAHKDIARSAQLCLEDTLLWIIRHHLRQTGLTRLCTAGGTFLNCVANGRIARESGATEVFVQPASHDAGTAIGAGALSAIRAGERPDVAVGTMALGTHHDPEQIERVLQRSGVRYRRLDDDVLIHQMASHLAESKIGAVFRGRMEFGPRALGMRSILSSPIDPSMRERLNRLKGREDFRPVAPLVIEEATHRYFDGHADKYMIFACKVRDDVRGKVPSATHVDGSARVQVVRKQDDPFLHSLLRRFEGLTGVPIIVNTSFNGPDEPIVESPAQALSFWFRSGLDFLAMENFLVER
jgi:carbamoyltransferase